MWINGNYTIYDTYNTMHIVMHNIHVTYELKKLNLQSLRKKKPKTMERVMDKYSHREKKN